mmetsp:Transcript_45688/g.121170  ORF Transcript_45688/g.121170 Transcript_45688/m.121170 type:complete len:280 (-) Transcript_45688:89-928(-)
MKSSSPWSFSRGLQRRNLEFQVGRNVDHSASPSTQGSQSSEVQGYAVSDLLGSVSRVLQRQSSEISARRNVDHSPSPSSPGLQRSDRCSMSVSYLRYGGGSSHSSSTSSDRSRMWDPFEFRGPATTAEKSAARARVRTKLQLWWDSCSTLAESNVGSASCSGESFDTEVPGSLGQTPRIDEQPFVDPHVVDKRQVKNYLEVRNFKHVNEKQVSSWRKSVYPLHCAVQENNNDMVSVLLRAGADPNALNSAGLTPLQVAFKMQKGAKFESYKKTIRALTE